MTRLLSRLDIRAFPRRKKVHFYINIFIGIFIIFLFHFIEHTDLGENTINSGLDRFIRHETKGSVKTENNDIFFIDIDHKTYVKWGEPLLTPRDKIAKMIEYAYKGNAKVIVIDILFENEDCCTSGGDERLRDILTKIAEDNASIKIIFPVGVGHDKKIKGNLFDDLIDKNPDFYRAIPSISATSRDRVNRYWVTYTVAKGRDDKNCLLWGVPLLAAVLSEGVIDKLDDVEEELLKNHNSKKKHKDLRYEINFGNENWVTVSSNTEDLYSQRTRFLLIPPTQTGPVKYQSNLLLNRLTADDVKEQFDIAANKKFYDSFKDKIVIIGNSSPDAGDIHLTPIGNMAGMYIIGNSTYTIINGLQLSPTLLYINIIIEIGLIISASYLFLYFSSFTTKLLMTIALWLLALPGFYFFSKSGVYFNFLLPVIGISIYEFMSTIEEDIGTKGIKQAMSNTDAC